MAAIYCGEDAGGSGLRRIDAVRIFEQLAAADPTVAAFLSIHNMCAWMVDTYGTHEQRKSWVPKLASMEAIASYCLTEPGAGSDAGALRTKAVRDGDDYVLDGVKQFISGAGASDVYVVMARTGGDGPGPRYLGVHRRKGHAGAEFRRQRGEDGLARPAHRAGHLRGRPGACRRDARRRRRRGHRLLHRDERAQRRPDQHRGVLARRRPGRLRQGGELPGRPAGVRRRAARRADHPVQARRHGHRAGDVANPVVAGGNCARRRPPRQGGAVRDGQALRHRRLLRRRRPGPATARRLRLSHRVRPGEDRPRSAGAPNPRGNQRNHARGHRSGRGGPGPRIRITRPSP